MLRIDPEGSYLLQSQPALGYRMVHHVKQRVVGAVAVSVHKADPQTRIEGGLHSAIPQLTVIVNLKIFAVRSHPIPKRLSFCIPSRTGSLTGREFGLSAHDAT